MMTTIDVESLKFFTGTSATLEQKKAALVLLLLPSCLMACATSDVAEATGSTGVAVADVARAVCRTGSPSHYGHTSAFSASAAMEMAEQAAESWMNRYGC